MHEGYTIVSHETKISVSYSNKLARVVCSLVLYKTGASHHLDLSFPAAKTMHFEKAFLNDRRIGKPSITKSNCLRLNSSIESGFAKITLFYTARNTNIDITSFLFSRFYQLSALVPYEKRRMHKDCSFGLQVTVENKRVKQGTIQQLILPYFDILHKKETLLSPLYKNSFSVSAVGFKNTPFLLADRKVFQLNNKVTVNIPVSCKLLDVDFVSVGKIVDQMMVAVYNLFGEDSFANAFLQTLQLVFVDILLNFEKANSCTINTLFLSSDSLFKKTDIERVNWFVKDLAVGVAIKLVSKQKRNQFGELIKKLLYFALLEKMFGKNYLDYKLTKVRRKPVIDSSKLATNFFCLKLLSKTRLLNKDNLIRILFSTEKKNKISFKKNLVRLARQLQVPLEITKEGVVFPPVVLVEFEETFETKKNSVLLKVKKNNKQKNKDKFHLNILYKIKGDEQVWKEFTVSDEYSSICLQHRNKYKKRKPKTEDAEIIVADKSSFLLWLKADPSFNMFAYFSYKFQTVALANHLRENNKDIKSQVEALMQLRQSGSTEELVLVCNKLLQEVQDCYKLRALAVIVFSDVANKKARKELHLELLTRFFINKFSVVATNNFENAALYLFQKRLLCIVINSYKITPRKIVLFLIELVEENDNSFNFYEDELFLANLVSVLGKVVLSPKTKHLVSRILFGFERLEKKSFVLKMRGNLLDSCVNARSFFCVNNRDLLDAPTVSSVLDRNVVLMNNCPDQTLGAAISLFGCDLDYYDQHLPNIYAYFNKSEKLRFLDAVFQKCVDNPKLLVEKNKRVLERTILHGNKKEEVLLSNILKLHK